MPNCFFDALERQDFFEFKFNSQWMKSHLGTNKFPVTSERFSNAFPSLVEKYGPDQELDFELKMVRPRVIFGPESGENVKFSVELRYGIKELGSMNYIIYDQMLLETTFNLEISEEIVLAEFMTMQVSQAGEPRNRNKPIYSDEDFTEDEYDEFWAYANLKTEAWFAFFNEEVFGRGVPLPYQKLSFLTKLSFHPRAMSADRKSVV